MIFEVTPSQTVGPYFAIGMRYAGQHLVVPEGSVGAIRISGTSTTAMAASFQTM